MDQELRRPLAPRQPAISPIDQAVKHGVDVLTARGDDIVDASTSRLGMDEIETDELLETRRQDVGGNAQLILDLGIGAVPLKDTEQREVAPGRLG